MTHVVDAVVHRWTRDEYQRMTEAGLLLGTRTELIEGQVIEMAAMGSKHASALAKITRWLVRSFPDQHIRIQMPLSLDAFSEPEPDAAVVAGSDDDYAAAHPTTALLVIEVSDTTLNFDRHAKAGLYARAGIAEYWIVNVQAARIEVLRAPQPDASLPFGHGYARSETFAADASIAPLFAAEHAVAVASLLP